MRKVTFLILISLTTVAKANTVIKKPDRNYIPMAEAALYVTKHFIITKTVAVTIMEKCSGRHQLDFQKQLLNYLIKNLKLTITIQLFYTEPNEKPRDYNIFIVDSMKAFLDLRFNFPKTLYEQQLSFFIILTMRNKIIYMNYIMIRIFEHCRLFNVNNAIIMIEYPDGSIGFFTYELFGRHYCQRVLVAEEYNRFRNGTLQYDYLFPERLRNLYNCSLNICARILDPLLKFYGDHQNVQHRNNLGRLSGIDGDVLKIIADTLNFHINLYIPEISSHIGTHDNSTGCYAALENGMADVAIGGLGGSAANHYIFTPSVAYYQTPFVFIVRSDLHFGPLKQLANPFCGNVWFIIGLTLIIGIGIINALEAYANTKIRNFIIGRNNHSPITNLITISLGSPIRYLPRRNFARFLLVSWMLITFVLRNAYQGKMFDSLRLARRAPIPNSLSELIERRYTLISSSYVDYYPPHMTQIMHHVKNRYAATQSTAGFVTTSVLDTLAHYNYYNWRTSRLTYVTEHIYLFQLAMYFKKHSIFKIAFDRKLKQLRDSGVIEVIASQHVKKKFHSMNDSSHKLPVIRNIMLEGLYGIYMVSCSVAFIIFALELLTRRWKKLENVLDWAHYNSK